MKLTQKYPLHFNSAMTFELTDSSVIVTYRGWDASGTREYLLSDFGSRTSTYKAGNSSLPNYAWFFLTCGFLSVFARHFYPMISLPLLILFLTLACLCFAVLFFGKKEYEGFLNKNGQTFFAIRRSSAGDEKLFLEELKKRII